MSVRFSRPAGLAQALEELDDEEAVLLAGGQSVVLLMNLGLLRPGKLVSLDAVGELRGLARHGGVLDAGALCTHDELANHALVAEHFPAAVELFCGVGNVRVRTAGTLGGNLVHADPAQDPPVLLAALDALAVVANPGGTREIPVADLADGPLSTVLEPGEILTRVRIPLVGAGVACSYSKFRSGPGDDYATVSVAARIGVDGAGRVAEARLVAGAVGPTVVALDRAAALLVGQFPGDADVRRAVHEAVRDTVAPFPDRRGSTEYKQEMAGVVALRAVEACVGAAGGGPGTGHGGGEAAR